MWPTKLVFFLLTLTASVKGENFKEYCQPGQPCWPSQDEVDTFEAKLSLYENSIKFCAIANM
jgi:hypothetical protein